LRSATINLPDGAIIGTINCGEDFRNRRADAPQSGFDSLYGSVQGLHCILRRAASERDESCHLQDPWLGDPRFNIQNAKGKATPYQVRQVLLAIERMEENDRSDKDEAKEDSE